MKILPIFAFDCVLVWQANILLTKGFEPKLCDLASSHLSSTSAGEGTKDKKGGRRRRISSLHMNLDTSPLYAPPEALDATPGSSNVSVHMMVRT